MTAQNFPSLAKSSSVLGGAKVPQAMTFTNMKQVTKREGGASVNGLVTADD